MEHSQLYSGPVGFLGKVKAVGCYSVRTGSALSRLWQALDPKPPGSIISLKGPGPRPARRFLLRIKAELWVLTGNAARSDNHLQDLGPGEHDSTIPLGGVSRENSKVGKPGPPV